MNETGHDPTSDPLPWPRLPVGRRRVLGPDRGQMSYPKDGPDVSIDQQLGSDSAALAERSARTVEGRLAHGWLGECSALSSVRPAISSREFAANRYDVAKQLTCFHPVVEVGLSHDSALVPTVGYSAACESSSDGSASLSAQWTAKAQCESARVPWHEIVRAASHESAREPWHEIARELNGNATAYFESTYYVTARHLAGIESGSPTISSCGFAHRHRFARHPNCLGHHRFGP